VALLAAVATAVGTDRGDVPWLQLQTIVQGSGRVPHVRISVHGLKTMFSNAFISSNHGEHDCIVAGSCNSAH
jgi:hypothetical protein